MGYVLGDEVGEKDGDHSQPDTNPLWWDFLSP